MALGRGFEPRQRVPKTRVLPLDDPRMAPSRRVERRRQRSERRRQIRWRERGVSGWSRTTASLVRSGTAGSAGRDVAPRTGIDPVGNTFTVCRVHQLPHVTILFSVERSASQVGHAWKQELSLQWIPAVSSRALCGFNAALSPEQLEIRAHPMSVTIRPDGREKTVTSLKSNGAVVGPYGVEPSRSRLKSLRAGIRDP